jgi:hypothetical protein
MLHQSRLVQNPLETALRGQSIFRRRTLQNGPQLRAPQPGCATLSFTIWQIIVSPISLGLWFGRRDWSPKPDSPSVRKRSFHF